jgi:hypothetical protein
MSVRRKPRRLDRATAEQLLTGTGAAGAAHPRLAALLAAAAAPLAATASPRGEAAALAAFRDAHRAPAPASRASALRTWLAKLLTVKVGLVSAAVVGLGGVAVASAGEFSGPPHSAIAPSPSASVGPTAAGDPTASPNASPSQPVPADLVALCQKYARKDADHRAKALDDNSFRDLVNRAGAKDRDIVDGFCAAVLHALPSLAPSDSPSTHPNSRSKPPGAPSKAAKPEAQPSARPSSRQFH